MGFLNFSGTLIFQPQNYLFRKILVVLMPNQANLGYQGTGGPLRRRDILAAFVNYERHAVPLKIFLVKIDLR